ncbi:MAG: bifunctional demethylmenaquinone methyltransferase/2-methoxy-6-polyprenyl-1,4-benzoquinol methylase UbiE [Nitrospirota bacterium]
MNLIDHKKRDAKKVEQMFSGIAPRYDLLNHVLSFGFDFRWRKRVAKETGNIECHRILDVCTGTGDMAIELSRYWKGKVIVEGLDFSRELLEIGRRKIKKYNLQKKIFFREGNAENLPYKDSEFDAITIAFGLRNIKNRLKALKEFYRVARPGGCFICLEFSEPTNPIFSKIYPFYLMKLLPFISKVLGSDPAAYRYLGNTIRDFPSPQEFVKLIESAGWKEVTYLTLASGIVAIHKGTKT